MFLQAGELGTIFGTLFFVWAAITFVVIFVWWWIGSLSFRTKRVADSLSSIASDMNYLTRWLAANSDNVDQARVAAGSLATISRVFEDEQAYAHLDDPKFQRSTAQVMAPAPAPSVVPSMPSAQPYPSTTPEKKEIVITLTPIQAKVTRWVLIALGMGLTVWGALWIALRFENDNEHDAPRAMIGFGLACAFTGAFVRPTKPK